MKKQITLFIFMVLVTMIIFLKRMNAMEGDQQTLVSTKSETRKPVRSLNKLKDNPSKTGGQIGTHRAWK